MTYVLRNPFGFSSFFDDDFGFFSEPTFFRQQRPVQRRVVPSACAAHGRGCGVQAAYSPRCSGGHCARRTHGGNLRRSTIPSGPTSFFGPASVFDMLNIGSDFSRFWSDLDDVYSTAHLLENTTFDNEESEEEVENTAEDTNEEEEVDAPANEIAAPDAPATTAVAAPAPKKDEFYKFGEIATRINAEDKSAEYDIHLPGLALEDVKLDLDLDNHALTIKAEKKEQSDTSFRRVSITRVIPINKDAKAEDVSADFVDGTLHIAVSAPKAIEPSPSTDTPTATTTTEDIASPDNTAVAEEEKEEEEETSTAQTASATIETTPEETSTTENTTEATVTDTPTTAAEAPTTTLADSSEVSVEDAVEN